MNNKKHFLLWIIVGISSCYSLFDIFSYPTSIEHSIFGFSAQRILISSIPFFSLLVSILMMVNLLFSVETYQIKMEKINSFFSKVNESSVGVLFWTVIILSTSVFYFKFAISPYREVSDSILGINGSTFIAYGDRLWATVFIIIIWLIVLVAAIYRSQRERKSLDYYLFFQNENNENLMLGIGFFGFILLNLYNLYWIRVIDAHTFGADFFIYFDAYIKALSGENPYEPYNIGSGFINHPFLLSIVSILVNQEKNANLAYIAWSILSFLAWMFSVIINLQFVQDMKAKTYLFILFILSYGPFYEMLYIGQVNAFVVLALSLMLYFRDKEWPMGFFLAIAIVLKTSPALFLAYLFITRRWKALVSCCISLIFLTILPILQFEPKIVYQFINSILKVGFEIHTLFYNESLVNALYSFLVANHIGQNPENMTRMLTTGLMMTIVASVSIARLIRNRKEVDYILFIIFTLVMVIFSPLVWYHHIVFVLFALIGLFVYPISVEKKWLLGICSIFLIQLQRVVEIFKKPGFPTLLVTLFLLIYFVYQYFSRIKIKEPMISELETK